MSSGESVVPEQTHEVETLQRGAGSERQGEGGAAGQECVWARQRGAQRAGGVRVRERGQERVRIRRGPGGKLWRTIGAFWAQQNQRDHERERASERRAGGGHRPGHAGLLTDTHMKAGDELWRTSCNYFWQENDRGVKTHVEWQRSRAPSNSWEQLEQQFLFLARTRGEEVPLNLCILSNFSSDLQFLYDNTFTGYLTSRNMTFGCVRRLLTVVFLSRALCASCFFFPHLEEMCGCEF